MDHDKKKALSALRRRFEYSVMDSPRSWAVAAACCWMNVFTLAMVRSAAVVFVGVLQTFNVSREEASWPVNLSSVCYFLTGTLILLLKIKYGTRMLFFQSARNRRMDCK